MLLFFLGVFEKKTSKCHEKILFDSGVINLQTPTTKYLCFQYNVTDCTRSAFSRSVTASVAVSSLYGAYTNLFFIDQGTKVTGQYCRGVLVHQHLLPAIRDLSGDFFTFQQDNAPAHRACPCSPCIVRAAVNM